MPLRIDLQEYQRSGPLPLSARQRDAIRAVDSKFTIEAASETDGLYTLKADSKVGAFEVEGLSVLIRPKMGIPQLLSLACYAISQYKPRESDFDFPEAPALPDWLALALGRSARQAFSRGVVHGYITREEALPTVRGRIRFAEQIRSRYGIAPPIEVRYQEFTDDVLPNQLIKAAAHRLSRLQLRVPEARRGLGYIAGVLENVSYREFSPRDVPNVEHTRLNEHYARVIALSQLILRHGEYESNRGDIRASGFLMDMNLVFQEFVTTALREELRDAPGELRSDSQLSGRYRIYFNKDRNEDRRVPLKPDLTLWRGGRCVWVGDAKYKNIDGEGTAKPPDLYQMLAYTTALNLPCGTLIYAKDKSVDTGQYTYTVRHAKKKLDVVALDLDQQLDDILGQVHNIANRLKGL